MTETKNKYALYFLMSLFFMWGFITCLNDILIPHLKALFELTYLKTMLIQFSFFGAYFLMSLPSGWVLSKIGYQKGIVLGLLISGLGAFLFIPASIIISYPFFLFALFTLASGITLLQVSSNPYVAILGSKETASSRLNLTQALNSLGTTIAPTLGSILILSNNENISSAEHASKVQGPYLVIALVLILIAVVFWMIKLPSINFTKSTNKQGSAWKYPHLVLGAVAIFLYVGAEVGIGSFLISFIVSITDLKEASAGIYVSYYWGGLMVGRFIGSYILKKIAANKIIAFNSIMIIILIIITIFTDGFIAIYSIILVGLFESIMFPSIFTLSISDLGEHTSQGSGILCMAIVGGAILPLVMGAMADSFGVQNSFIIAIFSYIYIFFYAIKGYKHHL